MTDRDTNIYFILRKMNHFTLEQLAKEANLAVWPVQSAEYGYEISLSTAISLAKVYKCSVHSLVHGDLMDALQEIAGRKDFPSIPAKLAPEEGVTVTTLEVLRKRAHLSQANLAEMAGTTQCTVMRHEKEGFDGFCRMNVVMGLAKALGVTEDELVQLRSVDELLPGDRSREAKTKAGNAIDNYRVRNNLTLRHMAGILGISHEGVSKLCRRTRAAEKYIRMLCAHDGITFTDFMELYGNAAVSRA